ncbi:hypothetical protein CFAM422_009351 [Trichoderma lentiforme]|uniref:Uncharacterized protein n=1 Tax=Trichoderma lentiforme TaxID=1567552 RepID=A0A9P4X9W0_9HYPO|nr:hypothetical protein CFAM422_009351 [Trichoderma lentiforme]
MTDPLDDELASTRDYPEEMDLDREDIDLDDVVPDLNPLNSATGEVTDYMYFAGINRDLETGAPNRNRRPSIWLRDAGDSSHSYITSSYPRSGSLEQKSPSQNAATPSADPAKVKVAPSVKTDSRYGSVTHETPKLPQKLQAERILREPLDIGIERRLIEPPLDIVIERRLVGVPPFQGHEDATNSQTLYIGDQNVMGASKTRRYILEFVNHLYSHFQEPFADDKIRSVIGSLRDLLEAFAIKLGQTSQLQIKRDAMYFIYTQRE